MGRRSRIISIAGGNSRVRAGGNPAGILLLNHKMPKVSGLEVLKAIKADEHLKMIPVVALTSSRETPDLNDFYKHKVNSCLEKPVDFPEFIKAVNLDAAVLSANLDQILRE